ncbi:heme A synthase, partial [Streptomyces ardesiacus]
TDLPEVLVGLHMFGSCVMWIAVLRVLLSLRERPEETVSGLPAQEYDATSVSMAGPR